MFKSTWILGKESSGADERFDSQDDVLIPLHTSLFSAMIATLITYTSYRNNKLKSATIDSVTTSYTYDGMGRRISQTVDSVVTDYLLDVQPQLAQVIASTTGANTERYVHSPRGIHAMEDSGGDWTYALQDALGNVHAEATHKNAIQGSRNLAPYLTPFDEQGSFDLPFVTTGEMTDSNGLVHLRERYLNPEMGVFTALDPWEGISSRPMSLNGYGWVEGNPVMNTDPDGMCPRPDGGYKARECEAMRQDLRGWGVNVVYDRDPNVMDTGSCLPEDLADAINQSQNIQQRWTLSEMDAIYIAFRIFAKAGASIGFESLPLVNSVTIAKQKFVDNTDEQSLGIHYYERRRIVMSAANWGEGEQTSYDVNSQIRT